MIIDHVLVYECVGAVSFSFCVNRSALLMWKENVELIKQCKAREEYGGNVFREYQLRKVHPYQLYSNCRL